MNYIKV